MTTMTSRPADRAPIPKSASPGGTQPTGRQEIFDAQLSRAMPKTNSPGEAQPTGRQAVVDAQYGDAAGSDAAPDQAIGDRAISIPQSLLDPALALAADVLDDLERVRIATANRIEVLTREGVDKDGEERGFGLTHDHPDVAVMLAMLMALQKLEHEATLNLQRKMRKHPLGPWVKAQKGVGEKQGARLLAAIGDPYINAAKGEPRTVSALWAYCGLHVLPASHYEVDAQPSITDRAQPPDHGRTETHMLIVGDGGDSSQCTHDLQRDTAGVAAKRRKGERANWSTKAKMRAYLVAESCMKQLSSQCRDGHLGGDTHIGTAVPTCVCSPYRVIYDVRRVHTALTHPEWSDGHSHNDGLRVAAKEILKDLWREARRHHGILGPSSRDTQTTLAGGAE